MKKITLLLLLLCSWAVNALAQSEALSFTAKGGEVTLYLTRSGEPDDVVLETSPNGIYWNAPITCNESELYNGKIFVGFISEGATLYVRRYGSDVATQFNSSNGRWTFSMEGKASLAVGGNVMSLLDASCSSTSFGNYAFRNLFEGLTYLQDASDLKLPTGTLSENAFEGMFKNCTNLFDAPALPSKNLVPFCYKEMFSGCTTLITAPELPATTLASNCYNSMFQGCDHLQNAPVISATTLAFRCCISMFKDCTSLTTAPALPATTAQSQCYYSMFEGCTSLTSVPEFGLTTLASGSCNSMFKDCTSLTSAPELKSRVVPSFAYKSMFEGCTALQSLSMWAEEFEDEYSFLYFLKGTTEDIALNCRQQMINILGSRAKVAAYLSMVADESSITSLYTDEERDKLLNTNFFAIYAAESGYASAPIVLYDTETFIVKIVENDKSFFQISLDKLTWEEWPYEKFSMPVDTYCPIQLLTGMTLYIRRNGETWTEPLGISIVCNCGRKDKSNTPLRLEVQGDVMSLLDAECRHVPLADYAFRYLFGLPCTNTMGYGQNFQDFSRLILPSEGLTKGCFKEMFKTCNLLEGKKYLPKFNAMELAPNCYEGMFENCYELNEMPELPATKLVPYCYAGMFKACTNLHTIPNFPDITLAEGCYKGMFENCSSLATAPELQATQLATSCYEGMFKGCRSLVKVPPLRTENVVEGAYKNMFSGCSSLYGLTLYATNKVDNSLTDALSGIKNDFQLRCQQALIDEYGGMDNLRTELGLTGAVDITATTPARDAQLLNTDYFSMTANGSAAKVTIAQSVNKPTGLKISSDKLVWQRLTTPNNEGKYMFDVPWGETVYICRDGEAVDNMGGDRFTSTGGFLELKGNIMSLLDSECQSTTLGTEAFKGLFKGCQVQLANELKLPAMQLSTGCYAEMFKGCKNLLKAPELPATELAEQCYSDMFSGCLDLHVIPALPAETTAPACYANMFKGCTSIKEAPALPATELSGYCYYNMFNGCSNLEKAPMLPSKQTASNCYADMFSYCNKLKTLTVGLEDYESYSSDVRSLTGTYSPFTLNVTPALLSKKSISEIRRDFGLTDADNVVGSAKGDLNNDGKVDIVDIALLTDILINNKQSAKSEADINGDNKVDIEDVKELENIVLGNK